ncbi:hypothetical protein N9X35_02855 [Amylibacter sp.]|nr:hypothetical protein [Amylibacter sp.]
MTKINFITPFSRKPAGGIRVVNDLCVQLSEHFSTGIWPEYRSKIKSGSNIQSLKASLSEKAHWIITEFQLPYLHSTNDIMLCYSIFVQNPYILFHLKRFDQKKILHNLKNAKYIFCISEDAENIIQSLCPEASTIRIRWSLDKKLLESAENIKKASENKKNIITYMPRKCRPIHTLLQNHNFINGYELKPLSNMTFPILINQMLESKIFISLSEYEGFAAPPVEAYTLGNLIVGYTGNGNEKLYKHKNFFKVSQNNYRELLTKLEDLTDSQDQFCFDQYYNLIEKFLPSKVTEYNLNQLKNTNFEETCVIGKNFSYPRNKVEYLWDSFKTKFYEI